MNDHLSPLASFDELPKRVLCIAPHPDDEALGCGGALALHARRGDDVKVVILANGESGLTDEDAQGTRAAESVLAAGALGVKTVDFLGLPNGALGGEFDLAARLRRELLLFEPMLVYGPSPFEPHPDYRAVASALASAALGVRKTRVLLYGIQRQVPANVLFDTSSVQEEKRAALVACESRSKIRGERSTAYDRAYAADFEDPGITAVEGFVALESDALATFEQRAALLLDSTTLRPAPDVRDAERGMPRATAVLSAWNKKDDVRANLEALRAQTLPFADIVVVDNASSDGTADMVAEEFPEVRLVVMPHSNYGACETFNIGFASVTTELTAILDDDVVLPPEWLEKTTHRLMEEPGTTAVLSTKVVEPGMPESYRSSQEVNRERYMSTFRGCASLARTQALSEAGGYDERLFIYGNERDLTCRLLNLGYRVLQYPGVETFHKTPFGIKMGKRSLYYHARNAWLGMLKYAPLYDLMRMPFLVLGKVLLRKADSEREGEVTDATGTIGIARSVRETPGSLWVLVRAAFSVLYNVPYCLKRREPVVSPDFELPIQ